MELSEDHKPDLPSERSRVIQAGHMVEDGRVDGIIAISRAIGDWEYKSATLEPEKMAVSAFPEVRTFEIGPQLDFVITACDGIWDCMTSQQAIDFVGTAKEKISNYTPVKSPTKSPMKAGGKGRLGAQAARSPPRKGTKNKLEAKLENSINNSRYSGLATVVEMMMDVNCPPNLHTTEGLGADNMTAIIIEFKK